MSDLFISYRRDDGGWARGLYAALKTDFDVFLDTNRDNIDYGDNFPQKISEALADCSVCLVLIGPKWVDAENLQRLFDAKDWVRREIQSALEAQPRMRVVPILIHTATLPAADQLPPPLQPLVAQLNDLVLTNQNWETACSDLVRRADAWLRGTMPSPTSRRGLPAYLSCLCDRVNQQQSLIDLVTERPRGKRACVCVLHGHIDESHDSFVDRIRHQRLLEEKEMFDARDAGLATCALQWNRDKARAGQYLVELRRALKASALQRAAASDSDLDEHLNTLSQPLIAFMQITWDDCQYCGPELLPGFIAAWDELFPTAADPALGPAKPALLWINLTYDSDDQGVGDDDPRFDKVLLPRLAPVGRSDILEWARLDAVKRVDFDFLNALRPLTDIPEARAVPGRLRMQRFVDEVRRIAASH